MYWQLCSPEQRERIYAEFNITEESLQNDITYLIEWMEKQVHLPKIKDEKWLTRFLIVSKNSLEKAKHKLEEYYKARALISDLVMNRDPTSIEMKTILKCMTYVALPKLTAEGYRLLVWKIFDPKLAQLLTPDQFIKMIYFNTDLILKADDSRKIVQIYDLENMSVSFAVMMAAAVRKINPTTKAIGVISVHMLLALHVHPLIEPALNTMKALLSEKIQKRVTFRGSNTDLTDMFPEDVLPCEYGGTGKSLTEYLDEYLTYAEEFKNWFNEEDSVKADLSKIYGINFETHQHLFGTDGSFRKLTLD